MKPCRKYKQAIVSLALPGGDLSVDTCQSHAQQHLRECPACLEYYRQMRAVSDEHSMMAECLPTIELPPYLLPRVRRRLSASPHRRFDAWRLALLMGSAALVLAVLNWLAPKSPRQVPSPVIGRMSSVTMAGYPDGPTLMTYHSAASRSVDELDVILSKQAQSGSAIFLEYRAGHSSLEFE